MTVERRLTVFERSFKPVAPDGCSWGEDSVCLHRELHVLNSGDPHPPEPAPVCPRCGRRRFIRMIVAIRDDGLAPPIPLEVLAAGATTS